MRRGVNVVHHFSRRQRTSGDVRNFLGCVGRDRRQEIIIIRPDSQIIRRHKECGAIRSAIENVGDLNRAKLPQKTGHVARCDPGENLIFALLKIEWRDFLDELHAGQSGGLPRRELQRSGGGGEAPSSKSQDPEKHEAPSANRAGTKTDLKFDVWSFFGA